MPPTANDPQSNPPIPPLDESKPGFLDRILDEREEQFAKSIKEIKGGAEATDAGVIADKELRRDLDALLQKLKALPPSRERSLCVTKLQEAIMWLGMDLKRLNDTRPYPSSYDPSTTKVEPTADGLKL